MDYTGMDGDRMFGAGDGVTLLDQIKADRAKYSPDDWMYPDGDIYDALLAAGELADAAERMEGELGCDDIGCMCETVRTALAAFRSAIEVK